MAHAFSPMTRHGFAHQENRSSHHDHPSRLAQLARSCQRRGNRLLSDKVARRFAIRPASTRPSWPLAGCRPASPPPARRWETGSPPSPGSPCRAWRAKTNVSGRSGKIFRQRRAQRPRARGIVRHVEHHLPLMRSRPMAATTWKRPGQCVSRMPCSICCGVTVNPNCASSSAVGDRQRDVAQLMPARQRRVHLDLFAHHRRADSGCAPAQRLRVPQDRSPLPAIPAERTSPRSRRAHPAPGSRCPITSLACGMLRQRDHHAVLRG